MHGLRDPQTRVLRKERFELKSHSPNEQFDVCSDRETAFCHGFAP